jgi:hypothetical protein
MKITKENELINKSDIQENVDIFDLLCFYN